VPYRRTACTAQAGCPGKSYCMHMHADRPPCSWRHKRCQLCTPQNDARCPHALPLLHRVVQPACLATWPSSCAAATAARPRLGTLAGVQRATSRSPATCTASKANSAQGGSASGQHCQDADDAGPKPIAPKQTRSSHTPIRDVPWNAASEAAVLQFWTEQGTLLAVAGVLPEQQAEQRRLRSRILRWAAKYPRHRDVEFLQDYMARVRDAAATGGWTDEAWPIALVEYQPIAENVNPAIILRRVQAAGQELAAHGIRVSAANSLVLRLQGKDAAAQVAKLQLALDSLPISLDCGHVVRSAPSLLRVKDATSVLGHRVAAVQLLHPGLDIGRLIQSQPTLLCLTEKTLAAHWASLQQSCGLSDDEMLALVQHQPGVLRLSLGVAGWRAQQLRAYESMRKLAGTRSTSISGWGRVLAAASYRVWRLQYLSAVTNTKYSTREWVTMNEERFAVLNPGYSTWLAANPIPSDAYWDGHV
jgi:hypothetical protein